MQGKQTNINILGGGFAGIRVAHLLSDTRRNIHINLFDRKNYHINTPVLFEIATAYVPWEKEAVGRILKDASAVPYTRVFDGTDVVFIEGLVEEINNDRSFRLADGSTFHSDFLVLALGSQAHINSVPGAAEHAFYLRTIDQAINLRSHIVSQFLQHRSSSFSVQQKAFTFVVVGGGTAGVEFAAELTQFLRRLSKLHRVNFANVKVIICEETDKILRSLPSPLRQAGKDRLKDLGVQVQLKSKVTAVGADHVLLNGDVSLPTATTVWLNGVRTNNVLLRSNFAVHSEGGLVMDCHLQVAGYPRIYAAGDCTYFTDDITNKIAPDVTWEALRQAETVVENILRDLDNKALAAYNPKPRPILLSIGGRYALAQLGPYRFSGLLAWLIKEMVSFVYLWRILPNLDAINYWFRSFRVKVSNDLDPKKML